MKFEWKDEMGRKDVHYLMVNNLPIVKIYKHGKNKWNVCNMTNALFYENCGSKKKAMELSESWTKEWIGSILSDIVREKIYDDNY